MSTIAVNAITDASGGSAASINGYTPSASNMTGRNRIINGAMMIDQRNAGASGTANGYTVDRWKYYGSQTSKGTWQQNAGSVTPPAGFINYLGFISSSSYSVISTDLFEIFQLIEGLNTADLGWGTANAKTITLSFWVRSSLTGTFGGFLGNSAASRAYPYSYTVSSADTWEKKSITIVGDTSGTWLTNNNTGIQIAFVLGVGSTYQGTGNAWNAGSAFAPTGATSVVGTSGATFYITGVQLEVGSTASEFEHRQYGQELALCQRYYQSLDFASGSVMAMGVAYATTAAVGGIRFLQAMRTAPTVTLPTAGQSAGTISFLNSASYPTTTGSNTAVNINNQGFRINGSGYTGLASGGPAWLYNSGAVSILVSAEL